MDSALLPPSLQAAARWAREHDDPVPILDEDGVVVGMLFDPSQVGEELDILRDEDAMEGLRQGRADVAAGRTHSTETVLDDLRARQHDS